jgi:hypothetical protein
MLLNYLKIFLRQFSRNRTFTAINLLGLATGLACFVLILFTSARRTREIGICTARTNPADSLRYD